jgi:hypothetical protein
MLNTKQKLFVVVLLLNCIKFPWGIYTHTFVSIYFFILLLSMDLSPTFKKMISKIILYFQDWKNSVSHSRMSTILTQVQYHNSGNLDISVQDT